jgi:hypothetical protein
MQDVNVLVVFHSRLGSTERLALAAAVGAVQGRANIRLRWLAEAADASSIESSPEWKENRVRMSREYVAPRDADAEWADAILAGMREGSGSHCPEFARYFEALAGVRSAGKLGAKCGGSFNQGEAAKCIERAIAQLGLGIVSTALEPDPMVAARMQGRRVAEQARALRSGS